MAQSICCKPNCTVCNSDPNLEWNEYLHKWKQKEQPKMKCWCNKHAMEFNIVCPQCNKEQPKMTCTCAACYISFASISDYQKHICGKEQPKMTRDEAEKIVALNAYDINTDKLFTGKHMPPEKQFIRTLEALGLLKFDEPKKEIIKLCSYERNDLGMIKVEEWSEGLVLWVGGRVVWKSWEIADNDAGYPYSYHPNQK